MTYTAYLFEARSIQAYILEGGRLADQVAASNLLDALCRGPLQAVLHCLTLIDVSEEKRNPESGEIAFPRRGGGAFYAVLGGRDAGENAIRLRDLWGIAAAAFCPGLEFVHVLECGETPLAAVDMGIKALARGRNRPPTPFPETPPLVRRSLRTGRPARLNDRLPGLLEWTDESTLRKRYARDAGDGIGGLYKAGNDLAQRFLAGGEAQKRYHWPRNLEPDPSDLDARRFPFPPDNAYVAVIHADGNGLGQALRALRGVVEGQSNEYQRIFRGFSDCIENATIDAARKATAKVLLPVARSEARTDEWVIPARPIVLGGDDLTIIVRADLALPFTVAFLESFEEFSAERLRELRSDAPGLDGRLTACAGVAFIKATQPFHLANHLAETLCARAKSASDAARGGRGGPKPSSLAFARITTSVLDETIRQVPLRTGTLGRLGAPAYFLGGDAGPAPRWDDLKDLAALLAQPDMARGPTRQLLTLLAQDVADAEARYRRWREVLEKDSEAKAGLKQFDDLLSRFGTAPEGVGLPFVESGDGCYTPLSDALALRAVGFRQPATEEEAIHD